MARPPTSATLLVEFLTRVSRTLEAVLVQLRNTAKRIAALDFCLVVLLVLCHVSSVNAQGSSTNVALASNGGVASASSFYAGFEPSGAINNERSGANWGSHAGWNDSSVNIFPDWLQVNFAGSKTINRVVVYTLQDNYTSPVEPTDTLTFSLYGLVDFTVQGWNGTSWLTLGTVTGNTLVKRSVNFTAFTTDRIRINVTNALGGYSRITEVEAWTVSTTTLSSSANPSTVGSNVTFTASVTGSNPTGSVNFTDGGSSIAGCAAVALGGSGNTRTAQCSTSALSQGTHSIVASYGGDASNTASASSALSQVANSGASLNVALASAGGVASASSFYAGFEPSGAINNERTGVNWGSHAGWNDSSVNIFPDWLQVNFAGSKTINRVVVYTLQDNYTSPVEPTDTMTFSLYGLVDFTVQGWNGTSWLTLGTVTGNTLVKRSVNFTAFTTDRIRINVTNALGGYSRITEVEAWTSVDQPPSVTLTSPADNTSYNAVATIPITATATDSDGTVSKVEFYQAATLLNTVTTGGAGNTGSIYSYNWTTAAPGAYALTAKAYDDLAVTTTSTAANVTVCAPTVALTSPSAGQTVNAPGGFTLTATASTPAVCGTITKVEFYNGVTLLSAPTAAPYTYNWTGIPAGNYTIAAIAYDSRGQTAQVTVSVVVNALPTATLATTISGTTYTAPATFVVNVPISLTLNATAADSDGSIRKVEFYNGASLLGAVSTAPYNFAWSPGAGAYTAFARAYDNLNATGDSPALSLTVCGPPTVSITSPTAGLRVNPPGIFSLAVNASTPTACGSITQVEYYSNGGASPVATGTAAPNYSASWSNVALGNYALTAKAYTTRGLTWTSTAVNVSVNTLPTMTLTPASGAQLTLPGPFTLTATASDPDVGGSISQVDFLVNNAVVNTKYTSPYTYAWSPAAGSYTIAARATDNLGGVTTTPGASIMVANAPTIILLTPTSGQVVAPGSVVTVSASSTVDSARGRAISTVAFQAKNSSGTVVWNTSVSGCAPVPCTKSAQFTPNPTGAYTITATVTDTQGATATSAPVTFLADIPPAVGVASDRSLYPTPPTANVQLTATATDSDGTVQSVTFYSNGTSIGTGTPGANNTYLLTWMTNVVGTYSLTAKATDNLGASTTSAPLTVSVVQSGPTTVYYHNDFEGSPLAATDAQGQVVWLETYAPYGERYLNQNTSIRNGLWYNGKPTEDSSGLSYYGGRWYNPTMGRFYSVDPQRFRDDNPLSFNRYAYANNNPYRFVDPNGHSPIDIGFLIWDLGKLGVALYNGSGTSEAAVDVGISVLGVLSPVPGSGLAIKGARAAKAVRETLKVADRTSEGERGGLNLYRFKDPTSEAATGWKEGDWFLKFPDQGSRAANWAMNERLLREEMSKSKPIFDSYRDVATGLQVPTKQGTFLGKERSLLESHGWEYNPGTGAYHPPLGAD